MYSIRNAVDAGLSQVNASAEAAKFRQATEQQALQSGKEAFVELLQNSDLIRFIAANKFIRLFEYNDGSREGPSPSLFIEIDKAQSDLPPQLRFSFGWLAGYRHEISLDDINSGKCDKWITTVFLSNRDADPEQKYFRGQSDPLTVEKLNQLLLEAIERRSSAHSRQIAGDAMAVWES